MNLALAKTDKIREITTKAYESKEEELRQVEMKLQEDKKNRVWNSVLEQFSNIISKIVELVDFKGNNEDIFMKSEDFETFIKLTTVELNLLPDSKLKIGLFKILDLDFNDWYSKTRQMRTISALYEYVAKNKKNSKKIVTDLQASILQ